MLFKYVAKNKIANNKTQYKMTRIFFLGITMYGYTENKRYEKTYWCDVCGAQVSKNCGHKDFGASWALRDLTHNTYWCCDCGALVSKNCGHKNFGDKRNAIDNKF